MGGGTGNLCWAPSDVPYCILASNRDNNDHTANTQQPRPAATQPATERGESTETGGGMVEANNSNIGGMVEAAAQSSAEHSQPTTQQQIDNKGAHFQQQLVEA